MAIHRMKPLIYANPRAAKSLFYLCHHMSFYADVIYGLQGVYAINTSAFQHNEGAHFLPPHT